MSRLFFRMEMPNVIYSAHTLDAALKGKVAVGGYQIFFFTRKKSGIKLWNEFVLTTQIKQSDYYKVLLVLIRNFKFLFGNLVFKYNVIPPNGTLLHREWNKFYYHVNLFLLLDADIQLGAYINIAARFIDLSMDLKPESWMQMWDAFLFLAYLPLYTFLLLEHSFFFIFVQQTHEKMIQVQGKTLFTSNLR